VIIGSGFKSVTDLLKKHSLNTICFEAKCPNKTECFSKKEVTFIIGGRYCTRNCKYCNVSTSRIPPEKILQEEAENIALAVKELGLKYVVITSVTRDDAPDELAAHFAGVCTKIKAHNPGTKVEFLIPDFNAGESCLDIVINSEADIIGHNIEVAGRELFEGLRPMGDFDKSLFVLEKIAKEKGNCKSGFMTGFGESLDDIKSTLQVLYNAGVRLVTIGQYLKPSRDSFDVAKYYSPDEFEEIKRIAEGQGFIFVQSGPFVRSSYKAGEFFEK
jgi:lipoic acid synthetase